MNGDREEIPDCEFFSPPSGGHGLARCLISVRPEESVLATFCQHCQVRAIRQRAYCRHLRFGSAVHIGLLSQTRVKAHLYCARRGNLPSASLVAPAARTMKRFKRQV